MTFARTVGIAALTLMPLRVAADGEFAQLDLAPDDVTAVASIARGPLSFGAVYSNFGSGADLTFTTTYGVPVGPAANPVTLRFGPTAQYEGLDDWKFGVRLIAEHYRPTDFGSLFLLGEVTTVDRGYFALAAIGLSGPGVTVELTHQGDDDGYRETAVGLVKPLGDTDISLRLGYKIREEEVFVGASWNTF